MIKKAIAKTRCKALVVGVLFQTMLCHGHNEYIHRDISKSAFLSSAGMSAFLVNNLGAVGAPFTASPNLTVSGGLFVPDVTGSPYDWVVEGSYFEDMQTYGASFSTLRSVDHFYTVRPERVVGQAFGITDKSEGPYTSFGIKALPANITNSFAWSAWRGILGPSLGAVGNVGSNTWTWQNARDYEFAAITNSTEFSRNENLARMLFSLGHVLHLNQDTSQPDHVRNDNHFTEAHRFIENFGAQNFQSNPQWFNQQPHGWLWWQAKGFTKLLDFWDRGYYTGSASALNADASDEDKLGLAEFSNGNFLGEDALYKENFSVGDKHYFPYPSLESGTDFRSRLHLAANVGTSFLKDGRPIQRISISKTGDGITVNNHSMLNYFGTRGVGRAARMSAIAKITTTIDDPTVLQEYHAILIPKAVEYSAGILDYFFRGQLAVSIGLNTNTGQYTFTNSNVSGQALLNGMFSLFQEDTNGVRILLQQLPLTGSLANGSSIPMQFTNLAATNTSLFMIYQGTLGTTTGTASDPVDEGIAIAVKKFGIYPYANEALVYSTCGRRPGGDVMSYYPVSAGIISSSVSVNDANYQAMQWAAQVFPPAVGEVCN